jgi:enediyne biosynthesis protein E4
VIRYLAAAATTLFLAASTSQIEFRNIAQEAGLTSLFPNGGTVTKQYIIETSGSGLAFVDYDNDNLPDLFVLSGAGGANRMYHNEGHDRFRETTDQLGLHLSAWSQGVCAGDFDNDGFTDLFVTTWGQNHLYRNISGKRFEDVTARAGLTQERTRYNTGCAFVDVDKDGHADLFVANYLQFDPATTPKPGANPYCYYRSIPVNCGPRGLPFDRNLLYHNNGDGTFRDISGSSGVAEPFGHYSLGVLTGDFNEDGLPDIYVACDQTPSLLYINKGQNKFEEEAVLRGVAFDPNGKAMSGMGVTAGDIAHDGHLSIFRSNFSDEFESLYRNRGGGNFDDVTLEAGLGQNTRYVGWGTGFFDFDNDGLKDLLLVNGHAFPEVDKLGIDIHYKDRAILYRNLGSAKFQDISANSGQAPLEKHSSRGAAFADIDNDGSVEVAVNNQNEPPSLWKLANPPAGHWIALHLVGTRSNRSALGAVVKVTANGHVQLDEVRSGGSYLSQNDMRLHFGLGPATEADRIELAWPSGTHQILEKQKAGSVLTVTEPPR